MKYKSTWAKDGRLINNNLFKLIGKKYFFKIGVYITESRLI